MPDEPLISVVVPAYNPGEELLETLASVEAQTYANWEAVLVDDGSDREECRERIAEVEARSDVRFRVVHQENRGLAGARNTGFRESRGEYVVPLDADDQLGPTMLATCLRDMREHPEAGFAYFDYRVFGDLNYVETPGEFNFYRLLHENFMAHCCFLPKRAWEVCGGYDERHRWGYEDWSFYINLAKHGFFGLYIPEPLFRYRTHGKGLHFTGLERHGSNWRFMEEAHPEVLTPEGRLKVKKEWSPSICVVAAGGAPDLSNQTLRDFQLLENVGEQEALELSPAPGYFWIAGGGLLRPQALEEAVLALRHADWVTWRDTGEAPPPSVRAAAGPLGVSRSALKRPEPSRSGEVRRIPWSCRTAGAAQPPSDRPEAARRAPAAERHGSGWPAALAKIERHLENAELLSLEAWTRHPARSAARLIPLRVKEAVNHTLGREVFDLSFYLKFQPRSVAVAGKLFEPVDYIARPFQKPRVGLITPHLSYGGAETVLLEIARRIDRARAEILLLAAHSDDGRMRESWSRAVDWIYDVGKLAPTEAAAEAMLSIVLAWDLDVLVIQNTPTAYAILPAWKERRPDGQALDVLHIVAEDWDFFSSTLEVAEHLDRRVVISEQGRKRLEEMVIPPERIRLIPNGVDLRKFDPQRYDRATLRHKLGVAPKTKVVLFLARLVEMKRPLLLADVARELKRQAPELNVVFAVGGSGLLDAELRARIRALDVHRSFRLLGHVNDPARLMAAADLLFIPSESEGVPLTLLEATAMGLPVVASRAGAIEEELPEELGVLVDPGPDEAVRLAEALHELLTDDERRAKIAQAARARAVERHSLVRAREAYSRLMDETLDAVERRFALGAAVPLPPRGEVERGTRMGSQIDR